MMTERTLEQNITFCDGVSACANGNLGIELGFFIDLQVAGGLNAKLGT